MLATFLWFIHFLSLLTLGACIYLFAVHRNKVAMYAAVGALGLVVLTWGMAFFQRKAALCPMCKGTPLLPSGANPHEKAAKWPLLNHGVTAVLSILFAQRFTCMYCGARFDMLKPYRRGQRGNPEDDLLGPR